jgi:Nucleoside-diphosphate-sugar epimerases
VLARSPQSDPEMQWIKGDLGTGEGVADAVAGVQVVVHAATLSPAARRGYFLPTDLWRSPPEVDMEGTRRLLAEAQRVGVAQFLYVSIAGVGRPHGPYLRLKHTAEELVRAGGVPWSIVRATQFHWLLDRMLGTAARLPALVLPTAVTTQPVDARDVAAYLVECVAAGPGGQRPDFGGPEVLTLGDLVEQWQQARGRTRPILKLPVPARVARIAAEMTCPEGRRGTTTWSHWLRTHPAE